MSNMGSEKPESVKRGVTFTQRESECIALALQSKDLVKIAENLNITENSVYFHLTNIRNKFELLLRQVF